MNMMMKKWKRGLAFVVAVVLALGLLPASAFAANEPEAQVVVGENTIEGSLYEVVEAVNSAEFATYTIELLQDVNGIGASVTLRNNIVLDLKDHTLTASGNDGFTVRGFGQQFTIQGGTLAGSASKLVDMTSGFLTLKNLNSAEGATFSLYLNGGSATISDCNLTSDNISQALLMIESGNVTVNDGSRLCAAANGENGVAYVNRGSLTVEDASLTGEVGPGIRINQGSLTLNSGALVETGNSYGSAVVAEGGTLIVNGDAKILSESMAIDRHEGAQILLNGGIFKYPHSIYEGANLSESDFTLVDGGYRYNGKSCSHSWGAWNVTKAATCAETGIQTHTCTLCKVSEDKVIPATGNHTWGDWTVTKAATCTEAGSQSHTCSVCGHTAEEEIPVIAHQFASEWSADESNHWHVCTVCGAEEDKAAHTKNGGVVTTKPTETTEGERTFTCTVCDYTWTEVIPAIGHQHSFSDQWSSDETNHWHACSGCAEQIEKAAHSFGDWTVTTAPTCTEVGSRKHTCSECGYTAEEEIPVTAHQFVTEWSHDETNHWHACANCDAKKDEAAHTENGGVVTTPATATTPGVCTYSCTVCGRELRTETIPATGGSTGGGSTGGGSTGGGSTGGGSTGGSGEENLPDTNTPQTGEPETGDPKDEENLGENDTPLVEKPFLFTDVGENRWFYPAVKYVFDRNLMGGIDTVTFSPNLDTSRGMLVTVLYRLDGAQERGETPDDPMEFGDVPAGKWFTDPVLWASDKGVVNGYGTGNFGPNDNVTREQVAAIFYRYAQYKGCDVSLRGDLSGYTDSDKVAKYAQDAMSWAVGTGIIGGMDTVTLAPKGNATRAQIATMLMRFDQFLAENQKDESTNQTVG